MMWKRLGFPRLPLLKCNTSTNSSRHPIIQVREPLPLSLTLSSPPLSLTEYRIIERERKRNGVRILGNGSSPKRRLDTNQITIFLTRVQRARVRGFACATVLDLFAHACAMCSYLLQEYTQLHRQSEKRIQNVQKALLFSVICMASNLFLVKIYIFK